MHKFGVALTFVVLTQSAEAQTARPGARPADCPPARIATDRRANVRSPRRLKNPYFAARPIYPPVERGAASRINFEPFTSKYYPRGSELGSNRTTDPLIRGR